MTHAQLAAHAYRAEAAPATTQNLVGVNSPRPFLAQALKDLKDTEAALQDGAATLLTVAQIDAKVAAAYQKSLAAFVPIWLYFDNGPHVARCPSRSFPDVEYRVTKDGCNCPATRACAHAEGFSFINSCPALAENARISFAYQIACGCGRHGRTVCAAWIIRFEVEGRGAFSVWDCPFCGRRKVV